ncbi:MAG: type IX secretion system membrane protein PorP/SprF [Bacteroidales bacterium]|nr:type IX secretion system membrane protein PorP/SprF [Bacteroidales bacterium]MBN2698194.1 type IX secretion system membrane protein PorP/SprF [Bacteroidales bacterium]
MKRILPVICLFFVIIPLAGQDPQFTQFYANPLYLAPSFAGATDQDRISATYRNQWPDIPGNAFVTYSFSYDHFFENFNSGVGLLLVRDVAGTGDLSLTNAGLQYSYDIKVNRFFHLRPGIHFNYTQSGIDYTKLTWNDQLTGGAGIEQSGEDYKADVDFGTSLLGYMDRYWFGFAIDHLLRPNYGLYSNTDARWPIKYSLFGGAQVMKKGHLLNPIDESLSIAFLLRHQFIFTQLDIGVYWYKAPMMFGLWYRGVPFFGMDPKGDALAFLIGYKMNQLRVGYSYDFTISNLVSSTAGAHEVSITYEFKSIRNKRKRQMLPCPEF